VQRRENKRSSEEQVQRWQGRRRENQCSRTSAPPSTHADHRKMSPRATRLARQELTPGEAPAKASSRERSGSTLRRARRRPPAAPPPAKPTKQTHVPRVRQPVPRKPAGVHDNGTPRV